jgi:hypothetical protein
MEKSLFLLFILGLFSGCSESIIDIETDNQVSVAKEESFNRLSFFNPSAWAEAIERGDVPLTRSGEVSVCARFSNDWRGMKIVKPQN